MENVKSSLEITKLNRNKHHFSVSDDYQIFWIADGIKEITVDLQTIPCYQNSILFLIPGRVVKLKFSCSPPSGWAMRFTREFFMGQQLNGLHISNADIFHYSGDAPCIVLSPKIGERINSIAEMISELCLSRIPNRETGISALLSTLLVYCDSNCNIRPNHDNNRNDLSIVSLFKQYVSEQFLHIHQVSDYAAMLNITPKYLNQVVKRVMGVTAKYVIREQLLIQACRDLKFSNDSVKEIAYKLGFSESDHFSHFFKKATGHSPTGFRGVA
jgi:AraC family transcriptional regulator, transcriptional activator of pobA